MASVDGAAGDSGDEVLVFVFFVGGHLDGACGGRDFGFRDEHLGDEDGAGCGHNDGGEKVFGVYAEEDVGGHDATGDVGHAGGHDGHEFGAGGSGEEGTDGKGSFGLAHEDAGGDVGGFGSAGAHSALHDPGDDLDDLLHETDVIEDGEEGADEDDGGKDGEGEDAEGALGIAERAEDERGAVGGVTQKTGDEAGDGGEDGLPVGPFDDEEGEDDLQAETPGYRAPLDGAAVSGEGISEAEKSDEAK